MMRVTAASSLVFIASLLPLVVSGAEMDLDVRGVGVPTASYFEMMDGPGEHQIEFALDGFMLPAPCGLTEGLWSAQIILSENDGGSFANWWYILTFSQVQIEVVLLPWGGFPFSGPQTVLLAEGGSATIRWHSEYAVYDFQAQASLLERAEFGPDCFSWSIQPVSGESATLTGGLLDHDPESSGPLFSFDGKLRNTVRIVPNETASWGSVKQLYR